MKQNNNSSAKSATDAAATSSAANSSKTPTSAVASPGNQPAISPLPKSRSEFLAGNGCILLATIFWGINITFTKALIPDWMSADGITAVRLIGGALLFWVASLFVKTERIARHDWIKLVLGGIVGLFSFIYLFVTSLRFANAIDISIIMTLPPVFVILIGVLFRHRRPGWMEYAGVVVSFIGAAIVILAGGSGKAGSDNLLGDLLAVASTICYAIYLTLMEGPSHTYRPVNMLRWVFLFAAVPAIALVPGMQHEGILSAHSFAPWGEIGFILLLPTFAAYFLVQPAIKRIGSELVSLYQYLLPVVAAISAVIMGVDRLKWIQVVAMIVIIAGMVLTNVGNHRRKK